MSVKPMLGDWEIPKITQMETFEERAWVELAVPGQRGSIYQDMNTLPTRVFITGSVFGAETNSQFLTDIRGKYLEGEPLTFVADILTGTDVQYVLVEKMQFELNAGNPDQVDYQLLLTESPPPPPPAGLMDEIDTGLLDDAGSFLDSVTGALDTLDALGSVPNLSDPTGPLTSTLDEVQTVMNDLDGVATALTELFGF